MDQRPHASPEMSHTCPSASAPPQMAACSPTDPKQRNRPTSFIWGFGAFMRPTKRQSSPTWPASPDSATSLLPHHSSFPSPVHAGPNSLDNSPGIRPPTPAASPTSAEAQQCALDRQICPSPRVHDLATVLVHKVEQRQQRSWKRKRTASVGNGFALPLCMGPATLRGSLLQCTFCGIALIAVLIACECNCAS